jgi:hypothetical protein
MARPSIEGVHVNLRIRRELRDKILARAERHRTSLNNMIRLMLEDGLEKEGAHTLDQIARDMQIHYARLATRLTLLERDQALVDVMLRSNDPQVRAQANALKVTHESSQRLEQRLLAEQALGEST